MTKFLIGFVAGIMLATVGVEGVVRMLDNGVNRVQEVGRDIAQ
jgi:hypothetical protein